LSDVKPISIFDESIKSAGDKIANARKLYFFHGLVDLRFFLSIYDNDPECIVCVPDWVAGSEILTEIVGRDRIIGIGEPPSVPGVPIASSERDDLLRSLNSYACSIRAAFRCVNSEAEAIFFNEFSMFPWFVLVGSFRQRDISITYVNIHPWLRMVPRKAADDSLRQAEYDGYFQALSDIAGVEISPMLYESTLRDEDGGWVTELFTAEGTGLRDPMKRRDSDAQSWTQLKNRFGFQNLRPSGNAVLFIETPFRPYWPSVDIDSTYLRVAKHLLLTLEADVEVHFKPHFENLTFDPFEFTPLGDRVVRLPSFIPAELYMPHYEEIFFYGTNAANEPVPGKLYCMRDLIGFGDGREKLRFETLTFAKYKDNEAGFIFIQ
jgi:hypothetical protein